MKSAQPSFSKALIYKNLLRFWPIFALYIISVLLFGYGILTSIPENAVFEPDFFSNLIYRGTEMLVLLIAFFSIVAAAAVFSYMHNAKATAMINALPFDRKTVFMSNYLAGFLMVMVPLLVLFLCLLGIGLGYGVLQIVPLLAWLLVFTILTLLLYSLAVFIGLITGNIIAHLAFYGIANFLLIGLEVLVEGYLGLFLYGFSRFYSDYLFIKATPIAYALSLSSSHNSLQWEVWAAYLLAALLLTWLAFYLYRKRKMENAGDVIAIHQLNPVFKYGVTICSSLAFGSILIEIFSLDYNFAAATGFFILMGMVGYFAAEMLMQKTFRVWHTYKGLVVYAVLLVLISVSVYNDWYGYACRMPDADKVEAVAFSHSGMDIHARLLEADRRRVYTHQIINMPDSMALAYGTPLNLERKSASESYQYPVMENLSSQDMKSLWAINPGIYVRDDSIDTVYSLHGFMVDNIEEIRDSYRQYRREHASVWNDLELRSYTLSIMYRLDNGKIQYYNFPVILPLYPEDQLGQQVMSQLAAIAGCQEERSKRAAVLDVEAENIRYLDINFHLHRYKEKLEIMIATEEGAFTQPMTIEQETMEIKPEDQAAFLQAAQADYQDMSDYQMFDAQYQSCASVDMQVEYPHLPSYNRFRARNYSFNLSPYNQNVFDFLQERSYIDAEIIELIK